MLNPSEIQLDKNMLSQPHNFTTHHLKKEGTRLRTFARNFSNIDFCLKILPLKDDELAMSEM